MDVNVYHFGFAVKHNTVLNNGDGKLQKLLYIMQLSLSLLLAQKLGQDGQRALSITGTPTWRSWPCIYHLTPEIFNAFLGLSLHLSKRRWRTGTCPVSAHPTPSDSANTLLAAAERCTFFTLSGATPHPFYPHFHLYLMTPSIRS